jgi:hypothetical protein
LAGLRPSIALALSARSLKLGASHKARLNAETCPEVLETSLTRTVTVHRTDDVFAP